MFLSFSYILMTTQEIANTLIARIRSGDMHTIYNELFSPDARNIEAMQMGDWDIITTGTDALNAKAMRRYETFEIIENAVSEASVNDNQFVLTMNITTKNRHTGETRSESEYILYTVADGKIVEEKFFYIM
jgi:hypothetical protein